MYNHKPDRRGVFNKEIDDNLIIYLYRDKGLSAYAIAKLTGWPRTTIQYRLERAGVYIPYLRRLKDGTIDLSIPLEQILAGD